MTAGKQVIGEPLIIGGRAYSSAFSTCARASARIQS